MASDPAEYYAVWRNGRFEAENPVHKLRTYFDAGIRVAPLTPASGDWEVRLNLTGYGYAGAERPVVGAQLSSHENRIDFDRGAFSEPLAEWYVNSARGLEQSFNVATAPDGEMGPVHFDFDLSVTGDLKWAPSADGRGIEFQIPGGEPVLRYSGIVATDSAGKEYAAQVELQGQSRVRLVIDGQGAVFPLTLSTLIASHKVFEPESGIPPGSPLVPPLNDTCSGAESIPASGPFPYLTLVTPDITDATTTGDPIPQPSFPACLAAAAPVTRSIWYTFTPTATNSYTISACADAPTATTVNDTVLAIYTSAGGCGGPFTQVTGACDDDSCVVEGLQSVVTSSLTAGTTYYILVWQWNTTPPTVGNTAVQLRVSVPAGAPVNDTCPGAELIPPAGPFPYFTTVTPNISSATTTDDPPQPTFPGCLAASGGVSRSIWYSFTPASSGTYSIESCNPPTGTTLADTVVAVYTAAGVCTAPYATVACNDDAGGTCGLRSIVSPVLTAGTTYYILVWKFGTTAPPPASAAVQLRIRQVVAPGNDQCGSATPLTVDIPESGSTEFAANDYQLSVAGCFAGVGHVASTAPGRDVAYRFTAPSAGAYSFRVTRYLAGNATLYVTNSCPTGTPPVIISSSPPCLGAANRSTSTVSQAEEVMCLPLALAQTVYAFVDEHVITSGGPFFIEVNRCVLETEPNGTPATAGSLSCGVEGSIVPGGDLDFYSLGSVATSDRVFAFADGVAANPSGGDFRLRVTTDTQTLEFDDDSADVFYGGLSPAIGGTRGTGVASFVKVDHFSAGTQAQPYRLYTVVQSGTPTAESEPNNSTLTADAAVNNYFSGDLSTPSPSTDVDVFGFYAVAGDLIYVSLDGDPAYNNTPLNAAVDLLDAGGNVLVPVNDGQSTSTTRTPAAGLTSTAPVAPAEALTFRVATAGIYYARVKAGSTSTSTAAGDYLLSISKNCKLGGGGLFADLSVTKSDSPDPVTATQNITYTVTVANGGPLPASNVTLNDATPANTTFVSITPPAGWTCPTTPPVGGTGPISCTTASMAIGQSDIFTIVVKVVQCAGDGTIITNVATVSSDTPDEDPSDNSATATTTVDDPGTCDDGNVCTTNDMCSGPTCVGGPPLDCSDGNSCTTDECDSITGCFNTPTPGAPCNDGDACTTNDTCSGTTCVGGSAPNCDDGNVCTDDSCNTIVGCVNICNNTCNQKGYGYWKRLCHGPHHGDFYTQKDVDCVNDTCTFATVQTIDEMCDRLHPNPNSDKCEQAEAHFMSLLLNLCRCRVQPGQSVNSRCGDHQTAAQSRTIADAALCNPARTRDDCTHAECVATEVSNGEALWANSLRLTREGNSIRLTWSPPYANPDLEVAGPKKYRLWRRSDDTQPFVMMVEVNSNVLSLIDPNAVGLHYEYELTVVW